MNYTEHLIVFGALSFLSTGKYSHIARDKNIVVDIG